MRNKERAEDATEWLFEKARKAEPGFWEENEAEGSFFSWVSLNAHSSSLQGTAAQEPHSFSFLLVFSELNPEAKSQGPLPQIRPGGGDVGAVGVSAAGCGRPGFQRPIF